MLIPIEKMVFVECNCISEQNEQEVLWVEEIAKQDPRIHELVSHLPERPLMLDHCGKPGIKSGAIEQWKIQLKKMSAFEHVYCKISGLLTEADLENWTVDDIFPM